MNTGKAHGSALGDEEVAEVKKILGFDPDKTFEVRDEVIEHTRKLVARGKEAHEKWQGEFDAWAQREPERKALLDRLLAQELPDGWDADLTHWEPGSKALATRAAFGQVLNDVAPKLPELWGGSADLAGSNNTTIKGVRVVRPAVDLDQGLHGGLVRPRAALRGSRARHGLDPVRHRATRPDPGVRRHIPAVLGLHAPGGAAGVADGHRHHLRLDARLDRPRRGRSHPSADRASGGAAGDPEPVGGAARRCERDRLRLAQHPGARRVRAARWVSA